jgi:hypothetical protein
MCCTKQSSAMNLDLFWNQVFSYNICPHHLLFQKSWRKCNTVRCHSVQCCGTLTDEQTVKIEPSVGNAIKLCRNKLERFVFGWLFQPCLILVTNPRSRTYTLGIVRCSTCISYSLSCKCKAWLNIPPRDEQSSLVCRGMNDQGKRFYKMGIRRRKNVLSRTMSFGLFENLVTKKTQDVSIHPCFVRGFSLA